MDASVQVTSTRHLGTSMPSRGRPPHHYPFAAFSARRAQRDKERERGHNIGRDGPTTEVTLVNPDLLIEDQMD